MSKLIKMLAVSSVVAFVGFQNVHAESCVGTDTKLCVNGFVAGGLQQTTTDNGTTSVTSLQSATSAEVETRVKLAEKNGWASSVRLNLDSDDLSQFETAELSATDGKITVIAGHTAIGGIDKGNAFVTELGKANEGTYGDNTLMSPDMIAVGVDAGANIKVGLGSVQYEAEPAVADDASTEADESAAAVNADAMTYVLVVTGEVAGLNYGVEYEGKSYGSPADASDGFTAPDAQNTLTIGLQYAVGNFTPFLNYGTFTKNADVTEVSTNIGLDSAISEDLGVTVALETIDSGIEGDDAESHTYLATNYALMGDTALGFGYWMSSKGDASENELTLELITKF